MTADLVAFLDRFRPDGYTTFVGIVPDGSTIAETFHGADPSQAAGWVRSQNRARNCYFTINPTPRDTRRKPTKDDITAIACLWADVDPLDQAGRNWTEERDRLLALADELAALELPPSLIIDFGNGIQPIWCLADPIEGAPEYRVAAEALCARIEAALGAKGTHNIDRLLRVPGTTNYPNAKKKELGRGKSEARLLHANWRRYGWRDLEDLAARLADEPPGYAEPVEYRERGYINGHAVHLDGLPDYPTEEQVEALLENHPNLQLIWNQTTSYPPEDMSPSGWDQSFASTLAALGFPPERVASYLRAYRAHHAPDKGKQDRADYILRTVARAQPADAGLGEAQEPGGCPPGDAPPCQAGQSAGASGSNGAGQQQTAGDAQGRNRGTFKTGPAQPKAPDWPEPGELGKPDPAPDFPTRLLPTCLRQWIETQAENMGAPADLLAVPGIVTIAGCIGRKATLRAKRHDWSWVERPCLWAAIIAPKGSLKTPALALATAPLRAAEARHRERWNVDLEAWEARQERGRNGQIKMKPDDPKPLQPKLVMTTTIEAMADTWSKAEALRWSGTSCPAGSTT